MIFLQVLILIQVKLELLKTSGWKILTWNTYEIECVGNFWKCVLLIIDFWPNLSSFYVWDSVGIVILFMGSLFFSCTLICFVGILTLMRGYVRIIYVYWWLGYVCWRYWGIYMIGVLSLFDLSLVNKRYWGTRGDNLCYVDFISMSIF